MHKRFIPAAICLCLLSSGKLSSQPSSPAPVSTSQTGSVTQGGATTVLETNLLPGCQGARVSGVGKITATDQTEWVVPADTKYETGPKASDLFNECSGVRLNNISELDIDNVPVVEIDADGDIITGYIFADNYFELYINGTLVAIDPVPFTPFNSSVARFQVKKPYTIAVMLVDWEENLGLGSEENRGDPYHAGDGGFIASFSDGTVTDGSWKAQTFYIAPLANPDDVTELQDGTRSTTGVTTEPGCDASCYAVHYPIPSDWTSTTFDATAWPSATVYTEATVGVDNKPSYTNFTSQFSGAGAEFIWSSNLVLDNLVLVRKTVGEDASSADDFRDLESDLLIEQIAPNPLSGQTAITFSLARPSQVTLEILDSQGKIIVKVESGYLTAGNHLLEWDGMSSDGEEVASGIYFIRITSDNSVRTERVIMVR